MLDHKIPRCQPYAEPTPRPSEQTPLLGSSWSSRAGHLRIVDPLDRPVSAASLHHLHRCPNLDWWQVGTLDATPGQLATGLDKFLELALGMRQTLYVVPRLVNFRWRDCFNICQLRRRDRRWQAYLGFLSIDCAPKHVMYGFTGLADFLAHNTCVGPEAISLSRPGLFLLLISRWVEIWSRHRDSFRQGLPDRARLQSLSV